MSVSSLPDASNVGKRQVFQIFTAEDICSTKVTDDDLAAAQLWPSCAV